MTRFFYFWIFFPPQEHLRTLSLSISTWAPGWILLTSVCSQRCLLTDLRGWELYIHTTRNRALHLIQAENIRLVKKQPLLHVPAGRDDMLLCTHTTTTFPQNPAGLSFSQSWAWAVACKHWIGTLIYIMTDIVNNKPGGLIKPAKSFKSNG